MIDSSEPSVSLSDESHDLVRQHSSSLSAGVASPGVGAGVALALSRCSSRLVLPASIAFDAMSSR